MRNRNTYIATSISSAALIGDPILTGCATPPPLLVCESSIAMSHEYTDDPSVTNDQNTWKLSVIATVHVDPNLIEIKAGYASPDNEAHGVWGISVILSIQ